MDAAIFQKVRDQLTESIRPRWDEEFGSGELTTMICNALKALKDDVAKAFNIPIDGLHPSCHSSAGEYMLNFVWTTYPSSAAILDSHGAPSQRYEIVFAAESEHGKQNSQRFNCIMVIDDFCKLLDISARFKLMVFRSHNSG